MEAIHGGDIYTNHVDMDFSVNVNPLGIPEAVEAALHKAVGSCSRYPDITAGRLKKAVAGMLHVPEEDLLFGNGASELFMAVVHGIRPRKTVIPVPSFYGYEYAVTASGGDVFYHVLKEEHAFCMDEAFFSVLTEEVDLLLLANPNNPTGALMSREYMQKLLDHCREKGICVVIDECFIEFCGEGTSVLPDIERFDNLILVRAFTKIFAIPGVRLGYLVCSSRPLLQKIKRQLPEWN
ncbi:MAG: aminotransferase class I/II-fold pyridoxal phosphate-dependent enzyme, partial [Lachnospiraceae bacterium]|nr:aminotransferase class I/II-fold pyridoxal phosphate-dependent enzyme [Lachnospiraceae bacterium]